MIYYINLFLLQLNVKRVIERRKFQEIIIVKQQFDVKQFNFIKIKLEEILFEFEKVVLNFLCNGENLKVKFQLFCKLQNRDVC